VVKILLVEDHELNREIMSRQLARAGFEVVAAMDGAQALASARTALPDLILLDMSLPVVEGWDVAQELKANAETRHIPVVGLSAHAMPEDRERALQVGCDDYVVKPVKFERLMQVIEPLLGHREK
jgi:two-component system cell cycle response regulator DivK